MKEKHYNQHPSGIECIDVVKHFDFCIGNVIKYVWGCGLKIHDNEDAKQAEIRDLLKARDYLDYKISMLQDTVSKETVSDDDLCGLDGRDWITHEIGSMIERSMKSAFDRIVIEDDMKREIEIEERVQRRMEKFYKEQSEQHKNDSNLVPKTDDICDEKQS